MEYLLVAMKDVKNGQLITEFWGMKDYETIEIPLPPDSAALFIIVNGTAHLYINANQVVDIKTLRFTGSKMASLEHTYRENE